MAHDKLPSFYWRYSVILLWLFIVMLKFRKIYQPAGIAFPVGKKTQLPYISQNFYKVVNKNAVKTEFQSLYSIFFFFSPVICLLYFILDILCCSRFVHNPELSCRWSYSLPDFIHLGSPMELNSPMKIVWVLIKIAVGAPK